MLLNVVLFQVAALAVFMLLALLEIRSMPVEEFLDKRLFSALFLVGAVHALSLSSLRNAALSSLFSTALTLLLLSADGFAIEAALISACLFALHHACARSAGNLVGVLSCPSTVFDAFVLAGAIALKSFAAARGEAVPSEIHASAHIFATAAGLALLLSVPLFFIGAFARRLLMALLSLGAGVLLAADLMHLRFMGALWSFETVGLAGQMPDIANAIASLVRAKDLLYLIDVPLWIGLAAFAWRGETRSLDTPRRAAVPTALIALLLLLPYLLFFVSAVRKNLLDLFGSRLAVSVAGYPGYHLLDAYQTAFRAAPSEADLTWLDEFTQESPAPDTDALGPPGFAKDANVIFIFVESFQDFLINTKIEDREVTPHLNRLLRESIRFSACMDQTAAGRSADAVTLALASILPPRNTPASTRYRRLRHAGLPARLSDAGYSSVAMEASRGEFWHFNSFFRELGFQRRRFKAELPDGAKIGWGIADHLLFDEAIREIDSLRMPYFLFLFTLSTHYPFDDPPAFASSFDAGAFEGTRVGDYLDLAHYTDSAVGAFVEKLRARGALDSCVLVIAGDHDAGLYSEPEFEKLTGVSADDLARQRAMDKVFLMMRIPHGAFRGEISHRIGLIDLAPAIAHLVGVEPDRYWLGTNPLRKTPRPVFFPDRSWIGVEGGGDSAAIQARVDNVIRASRIIVESR